MDELSFLADDPQEGTQSKQANIPRVVEYENLLFTLKATSLRDIADLPIFSREFLISGSKFTLEFKDIILGDGLTADNLSDRSLENALIRIPSLELVVITASDQLRDLRARLRTEYDIWIAGANKLAEAIIIEERKELKAKSIRKDIGQITAQQVRDTILSSDDASTWSRFQILLSTIDNEIDYLEKLLTTLRDRSMEIRNILNRRVSMR